MKKLLSLTSTILLFIFLVGCSNQSSSSNIIKIGVSPDPHAKLVNLVVEDLKSQGITVEVVEFTDYITPNLALEKGEIDANFFQHEPYLNNFAEKENLNIVSIGKIHVEPMALYSSNFDNISNLPDGATIAIPNDSVNGGRALLLLESHGIIKLSDEAGVEATEKDIVENNKNIKFTALEAAFLPKSLSSVDAAIINGNYALESGLNPIKDGLLIENEDSPYANLIAVREDEANEEKFKKLLSALQSEKVKEFINKTYEGAIIPAF